MIELPESVPSSPMDMDPRDFKRALTRRRKNRDVLLDWIRENLKMGTDFMRVYSRKRGEWSKPFLRKAGSEKILSMLGLTPTFPNLDEVDLTKGIIGIRCVLLNWEGKEVGYGAGARLIADDNGDVNKALKMALKSAQIDATLRVGGLSEIFTQDEDSAEEDNIPRLVSEQQAKQLREMMHEAGLEERALLKFYEIEQLTDLPADKFMRARKAIQKATKEKNDDAGE